MNYRQQNRFGWWLLGFIPFVLTGWWGLFVWTFIQIFLSQKEEKEDKQREDRIRIKNELKQKQEAERIKAQIKMAEDFGYNYEVLSGEVRWLDKKK